jgi:hypothetical protein
LAYPLQLGVRAPASAASLPGAAARPSYKREAELPEILGFRLGTLDSDPGCQVTQHFMVGSKAPWVTIEDSLRQESEGVAFGVRD